MIRFAQPLTITETPIPGLLLATLPVHGDSRGWFKEAWQREKMIAAGLPDFGPVQNNVSFNDAIGTTRGVHAEPWDKWISVATGRVFGAWVDLREGATFGTVFTVELDASTAIFVPRGVGNSYQTLEADTVYSYLVNDHWSADAEYSSVNLADETIAIHWPIPLADAAVSAKDLHHPRLVDVTPITPKRTLVIGSDGQLGRALRERFGGAERYEFADRRSLDLADSSFVLTRHWRDYDTIINAAAYTRVDLAETATGRTAAWESNVTGLIALSRIATENGITLVHISSDYVFDGAADGAYSEDDAVCPLGVYGQTKAAGEAIVSTVPRHYVVRTSWVIGQGENFVRTMSRLATTGVDPLVVDDQIGRLTFASDLAASIEHLLQTRAEYGIYNMTCAGRAASWADIAKMVFLLTGHDPMRVSGQSTSEYTAGATGPVAPRPKNSQLDTSKIQATGYQPADMNEALLAYLR